MLVKEVYFHSLINESVFVLKIALASQTFTEVKKQFFDKMSASDSEKEKQLAIIKKRYLTVDENDHIKRTPLLQVFSDPQIDEVIKKEIFFYHFVLEEPVIYEILCFVYDRLLAGKKYLSKEDFDKMTVDTKMYRDLVNILEKFDLIKFGKKRISIKYYPVSWQAYAYGIFHQYKRQNYSHITKEDLQDSMLSRIFLVDPAQIDRCLLPAIEAWFMRPAGFAANSVLLLLPLEEIVSYLT